MSVLAVSDLVFGDLLTELKIKPWWERIRGYGFAASVVSALFMTYITLSSTSVNCIPVVTENATTRKTVSITEANFINNYCFNQLPLPVSIFGLSPLCLTIVIFLISNYWTLFPDVINSFRTFAQVEEIIGNLNLTSDQLCEMSTKLAKSSNDDCKHVRKACSLLWKYKSSINVEKDYRTRNWVLIVGTMAILVSSGIMLYFLFVDKSNFKCYLNLSDKIEETIIEIKLQLCTYNNTKELQPSMIAFAISLLFQSIFTGRAILKFWTKTEKPSSKEVDTSDFLDEKKKYSLFMVKFWKNSKPTGCGALENLIKHIFYKAISVMEHDLEKAISEDVEIVKLCCYLGKEREKVAFNAINKKMKEKTFSVYSIEYANILQCIKYLKPKLPKEEFYGFIDYLCKGKYWELLARVFTMNITDDWVDENQESHQYKVEINFDEIGQPYELGRSFLFYFLSERSQVSFKKENWENAKYVHFDGKSMHVDDFIKMKSPNSDQRELAKKHELPPLKEGDSSQKTIGELNKELHEKTETFKNRGMYIREETRSIYEEYLESFAEKISRYRFDQWEEQTEFANNERQWANTKKLAEFANNEKQWAVLVALLNAYIVVEKEKPNNSKETENSDIIPCDVKEFTLIPNEEQNILPKASILYYALRKPPYLKDFQFAAVRHILRCTRGQEKKVRKMNGMEVSAIDFVKENDKLKFHEREELIKLLENSIDYEETSGAETSQAPATTSNSCSTEVQQSSDEPSTSFVIVDVHSENIQHGYQTSQA